MNLGAHSCVVPGTGTGHLARYEATLDNEPSLSAFHSVRQIRPLNGNEPVSIAWETGGLDTAVLKLLEDEKVQVTMASVFGIGRSDVLLRCQPNAFALVVTVLEKSTAVGRAVEVTQKLCSVLARYSTFTQRIHFLLTTAQF